MEERTEDRVEKKMTESARSPMNYVRLSRLKTKEYETFSPVFLLVIKNIHYVKDYAGVI